MMAKTLRQKIRGTRKKLQRVRKRLFKRRLRVRLAKRRQAYWAKKYRANPERKKALRKTAYWHEQLDKAVLGRKEFEKREARLQKKMKFLKEKLSAQEKAKAPAAGVSVPQRPWNPYSRPIANWIIPWLDRAWAAGWRGAVTSGFRSAEYQCEVCKRVCGNCGGCPGTCAAPGTSNHGLVNYPGGAVDVTDYYTFAAIMRRLGSPLHNSLGARDPVHFSASGN